MEGKAMKKQIILILSFLIMAFFLTACSTKVKKEDLNVLDEVAYNVVNATEGYEIPEEYEVVNISEEQFSVIHTSNDFFNEKTTVVYRNVNNTAKLVEIDKTYNGNIVILVGALLCMLAVVFTASKKPEED